MPVAKETVALPCSIVVILSSSAAVVGSVQCRLLTSLVSQGAMVRFHRFQ